ncbi:MAG: serine/threonine protein phosphatase [Verrucomicrobia bacterium]|nr:serine/threonine protein phosphatase [Verrucomicrobiota bacterium]
MYVQQLSPFSCEPLTHSTFSSVATLMSLTQKEWENRSTDELNKKLKYYCDKLVPEASGHPLPGFLEKHDLEQGTELGVIGDIHGHEFRLDLTLKALQVKGVLDQEYRCLPGKRLLFLGDYVDRGQDSLKVLELVVTLKIEQPALVDFLRGNHEVFSINYMYAACDERFRKYLTEPENENLLQRFYRSLPVSTYIGQKTDAEKMRYMHFTHALFHLYTDPAPLFQGGESDARLWVEDAYSFSDRVEGLMNDVKLKTAATKLKGLHREMPIKFDDVYWLDVGLTFSTNDNGRVYIDPETIEAYCQVSSTETSEVEEITRGHQSGIWTVKGTKRKVLVTTLDPSKDNEKQTFMIMRIAEKVCDWSRRFVTLPLKQDFQAALREMTESSTIPDLSEMDY